MTSLCILLPLLLLGQGASAADALDTPSRANPDSFQVGRPGRHVLVLYSDDRLLPANIAFDASLRQTLASGSHEPIECFSEFLDEARFPARHQERMLDFLRRKYGEHPPDAIVAFAPSSLEFCLRYHSQLFPTAPILYAAVGADTLGLATLGPRVTGVRPAFDGPGTLRLALRLHPRTERVFVVADSSLLDHTDDAMGWSRFREAEFPVPFQRLATRPLAQLLDTLARLPENSLVLYLSPFGNSVESPLPSQMMAARMAEVSRAPIYAAFDVLVGHGVAGAVTTPTAAIGRQTAELIVEVLALDSTEALPAAKVLAATPIFDWRQMRRWNLRKKQLPPGSLVLFESPTLWQQHSKLVTVLTAVFLIQSGLILALVLQSVRRRRAEREALQRRQELAHMTRVATMGELTASLAHEINQPLAAILSNAQAALRLLASGVTDPDEIREILDDIAADDQRAGEVIRRMRALIRKGESVSTILDVKDLVAEVVALVRGEMILHNITLTLNLSAEPLRVQGDRIQLQQVLLNLMMNALDALRDTPWGERRLVLHAVASSDHSVLVSVEDFGIGIPPDKVDHVFERFVTTKPHGLGLGLAICRSIIQAHGGRIWATTNSDRGMTFTFTVPAVEEVKQ